MLGDMQRFPIKWLSANGDYVYPPTPNNPEWKELEDYLDKVEACRIPQEVLKSLSDEQLVQAIIDYPLIYDVFFFSDVNKGVAHLAKTCDAFAELLERETAKDVLLDVIMSEAEDKSINMLTENGESDSRLANKTVRDEIIFDTLVAITIFQERIGAELSDEELASLADVSDEMDIYAPMVAIPGVVIKKKYGVMKTPNGLNVCYAFTECNHTEKQHQEADAEMVNTYGVTLVSSGTCIYNCHSYAWYNQSVSNDRWIDDPSPYMQDGSYTKVSGGSINSSAASAISGDIVVYGGLSHSAVMVGNGGGEPFATRTMISKWGQRGIFMHRGSQVPYDLDEISVWRRN